VGRIDLPDGHAACAELVEERHDIARIVTGAGSAQALRRAGRDCEHLEGVGTVAGQLLDATDSGQLSVHPDPVPSRLLAWVRLTVSSESEPIRTTSMCACSAKCRSAAS